MAPTFDNLIRAKLPVWATVKQAYALAFGNFGAVIAISWKWFLLVLLPAVLIYLWYSYDLIDATYKGINTGQPEPPSPEMHFKLVMSGLAYTLAQVVPAASIAVNWHRFILRGEPATSANGLRLDAPVMRYLKVALGLTAILIAPSVLQAFFIGNVSPLALTMVMVCGLAAIGLAVVVLRLSMMLPGVAVDNADARLGNVLHATRGHTLRLVGAYLLIALPVILMSLVTIVVALVFGTEGVAVMHVVMSIVYLLLTIVILTFMSIAYRFFYEQNAPSAPVA